MTEAVMSAGVLQSLEATRTAAREQARLDAQNLHRARGWNPESFAREQIRGLVQQVFFSNCARPVRQVVFSALQPETDVRGLCWRVGEALSRETTSSVAVVGMYPRLARGVGTHREPPVKCGGVEPGIPMRQIATHVRGDLWLVPDGTMDPDHLSTPLLCSFLGKVRREFEYSIVQAPPAAASNQTAAMARFADGVILVLSSQHTRRVAAQKVKETLEGAQARLLGTVLSDRTFPIPEVIYRLL